MGLLLKLQSTHQFLPIKSHLCTTLHMLHASLPLDLFRVLPPLLFPPLSTYPNSNALSGSNSSATCFINISLISPTCGNPKHKCPGCGHKTRSPCCACPSSPLPFWSFPPVFLVWDGSVHDPALLASAGSSKEEHLAHNRAPFPFIWDFLGKTVLSLFNG